MAVADALVSKVLDMLISPIGKKIGQDVRLVVGVKKQVNMLTNNLQSIQAVLIDAERRQWKEATVRLWVDRLKDVSYEIDDVLDEWSSAIMKSQRKGDDYASKLKRKVRSFILSPCFCFRELVLRCDVAVKITELNGSLDVIASEKDKYCFLSLKGNNELVERPVTTSVLDKTEVKGREVDKEKLIQLLLAEGSEMPKLRLISIVGMGGIGKTTLARLVYNDETVEHHFDKRIWVCVSDPFDEIRIAKEILESLLGASSNLVALPNIMEKIQESSKGKKILLVLDDVWNEDPKKWKQLNDCLKSGLLGGRILVTTRNANVGRIMGCLESDIFQIGLLSKEECWELFCMITFSGKSNGERASLEEIGREIVRRCKGLPLAVRTIAGLLKFKNSRTEWLSVLDSELWDFEEVERDIVAPLWLSYYDLPSPLKQCFSYCAIFPKDYKMEKGELIKLWMAQGYIKGAQSNDLEMIGDQYFQNLVMRSLFQDVEVQVDGFYVVTWCKMHDIVHDFAELLVKRECLGIEVDVDGTISLDDSFANVLRHLSISFRQEVSCLDSFYNPKKLRSLHFSPTQAYYGSFKLDLQKICNEFTSLRSLRLRKCGIKEIPSNINKLIHLRELDLYGNDDLRELPDTVWELYNLQILNLDYCIYLQFLKGLGRLTNLRHLDHQGKDLLLPKGMVRLSGLRRLNRVNIDVGNEEAFSLKHLKNFNQIGGSLEINWLRQAGDGDVEDARQAHMTDKKHITALCLGLCDQETRTKKDEELIEALNVPPNLEFLEIDYYFGLKTPNWMNSLTFVKTVMLYAWKKCELLPPLGKLPCLQDLELSRFYRVKKVGDEFLGIDEMNAPLFPKLTTLKFIYLDDWEEWNDVNGDKETMIMPSLTSLELSGCRMLEALPNFILKKTALQLRVIDCYHLENFSVIIKR